MSHKPLRVALIGAADVAEQVMILAQDFPELAFTVRAYQDETEAAKLLLEVQDKVQAIMFTGPAPYYLTRQELDLEKPVVYVSFAGSGLYRALFQARHDLNRPLRSLSIDTVDRNQVMAVMTDIGLQLDQVYVKECQRPVPRQDLVEFHSALWHEERADMAITGLRTAYEALQAMGVRAYRILPTGAAIREALMRLVAEGRTIQLALARIAVGLVKLHKFDELVDQAKSQYDVAKVRLQLHQLLLDEAARIGASLHSHGDDGFVIFTTQGTIEELTEGYQRDPLLESVRRQLPNTVRIGWGTGDSARMSFSNAEIGLDLARAHGGDCSCVVQHNGRVLGPLGNRLPADYLLRTEEPELLRLADSTGMSVQVLSRLRSILRKNGRTDYSAGELAPELRVSTRTARRILARLVEACAAEVSGEEQPHMRGRPRQIYRLTLDL